jgi:hypothetical protein
VVHLQAEERAAHQRAGVRLRVGALRGMLLWDGVQPTPGLQLDVAILRIVGEVTPDWWLS